MHSVSRELCTPETQCLPSAERNLTKQPKTRGQSQTHPPFWAYTLQEVTGTLLAPKENKLSPLLTVVPELHSCWVKHWGRELQRKSPAHWGKASVSLQDTHHWCLPPEHHLSKISHIPNHLLNGFKNLLHWNNTSPRGSKLRFSIASYTLKSRWRKKNKPCPARGITWQLWDMQSSPVMWKVCLAAANRLRSHPLVRFQGIANDEGGASFNLRWE